MSYSLAELTTPLTADEVEAALYAALAARGAKTTAWKPGAVVRTIIAGVAIVLAAFSSLVAAIVSSSNVRSWACPSRSDRYFACRRTDSMAVGQSPCSRPACIQRSWLRFRRS